jgi:hypothetical protein
MSVSISVPVFAITVTTTTFQGSSYNLITDNFGNEWLSLLATDGLSYSTVSTNISNALGDYSYYRFATKNEVLALFNEYGAPDIDLGQTTANAPFATTFQNDFGLTGADAGGGSLSWGYTSDILTGFPNFHVSPIVNLDTGGGGNPGASFQTNLNVDIFFGLNPLDRGSWLIKNTGVLFKNGFE